MNVFAAVELDLQNLTPLRAKLDQDPKRRGDPTHSVIVVGTDNKTFLAYCLSGGDIHSDNITRLPGGDKGHANA